MKILEKEKAEALAKIIESNNMTQEEAAKIQGLNARQQQIDFIQSRIEHCLKVDDEQSIIRYTDMLNKINALYKETEQEQKTESTVNNLDTGILKRLSGIS